MPEIQSEINGLDVTSDGFDISNDQQISRTCSRTIYGPPGE